MLEKEENDMQCETITGRHNALMTHLRKLASSRAYREKSGEYLCDGVKLLEEAVKWQAPIQTAVFSDGVEIPELPEGVRLVRVSGELMKSVSPMETPQGALFTVALPKRELPQTLCGRHYLVLDGVQDPGNLGTIIRIADWFGIRRIFCSPETADVWNPKVIQATMGSIARVSVEYTPLVSLMDSLPEGFPVYGTLLDGDDITKADTHNHGIIVMGNEGNGISPAIRERVTHKLLIPNYPAGSPTADSLNVAIATSITCFAIRQRPI